MHIKWPTDISRNTSKTKKIKVSALAYADDTTWVTSSKDSLQNIINISNEFFELNYIEINGAKSELVAWRLGVKALTSEGIWIGTSLKYIEAKSAGESTRFLGI